MRSMRRLALLFVLFSSTVLAQNVNFVMAYLDNWAQSGLPLNGTFNWQGLTHIIYFKVDPRGAPPYYAWDGGNGENYSRQLTDAAHAQGVKVVLCIGGVGGEWYDYTGDSATCQTVVNGIATYAKSLGFDGLDLDWESRVDLNRFKLLSRILHGAMANWNGGTGILTAAVGRERSTAYDIASMNTYYDYLNIMTYDCNGWWSTTSGFHEPVYDTTPNWPGMGYEAALFPINRVAETWITAGLQRSKTSLGFSTYPRCWTTPKNVSRPGQIPSSNGWEGIDWYSVVFSQLASGVFTQGYDTLAKMAWAGQTSNPAYYGYINYNSEQALTDKVHYLQAKGWGGLMIFTIDQGHVPSNPVAQRWPLLRAAINALQPTTPTAPTFSVNPTSQSGFVGETKQFSVVATGSPTPTLQWQKNTINIGGATSASYTTPVAVIGDNGATYRCVATNSEGSATSSSATLTVTSSAPSITSHPVSQTKSVGQTAMFVVTSTGSAPLSYQWQKNAVSVSAATSSSYTTPAVTSGDNGSTYRCIVTNAVGSTTSNSAILTVTIPMLANPTSDDFHDTTFSKSLWSFSQPARTRFVGTGTQDAWLVLDIPSGTRLDFWTDMKNAPAAFQNISNGDFEVVARFQSISAATYQSEGIVVKQDANTLLRFDCNYTSGRANNLVFYSALLSGTNVTTFATVDMVNSTGQVWIKVRRAGDTWTGWFSQDGTNFTQGAQFTQSINADSVGVFVSNGTPAGGTPPGITCKVDYFFNTASPLSPEDPVLGAPTGAFNVDNDTLPVGGGNITLTWTSANAQSATIDQGIGAVPLTGSRTVTVGQTKTFTLTLTNSVGSQTYQVRVFVPVPGAVTGTFRSSVDTLSAGGGEVTLIWSSANAVSASIDQGIGAVPLTGSKTVTVGQTKTFTLVLSNLVSSDSFKTTVGVRLPSGSGNLNDITSVGNPVVLITNPTGTGNKNIEIIRDGVTPPAASTNPNDQYDTFNGGGPRATDWAGYTYPTSQTFGSIVFQEGIHSPNGGYFSGTPTVEVRVDGQWTQAQGTTIKPAYASAAAVDFSTYTFRFYAITGDGIRITGTPGGEAKYISVAEFRVLNGSTGNERPTPGTKPKDFSLLPNYPNPFNPSTTIEFRLPEVSQVKVEVYNMLGQKVRTLVDAVLGQGVWSQVWDGQDGFGNPMSSGVYIYKMHSGNFVEMRKMILSK